MKDSKALSDHKPFNLMMIQVLVIFGVTCYLPFILDLEFHSFKIHDGENAAQFRLYELGTVLFACLSMFMLYDTMTDAYFLGLYFPTKLTQMVNSFGILGSSVLYLCLKDSVSPSRCLNLFICTTYCRAVFITIPFVYHIDIASLTNTLIGKFAVLIMTIVASAALYVYLLSPFVKISVAVASVAGCGLIIVSLIYSTLSYKGYIQANPNSSNREQKSRVGYAFGWTCFLFALFLVSFSFGFQEWKHTTNPELWCYLILDLVAISFIHTLPSKVSLSCVSFEKHKQQNKKTFVRFISHEIRTPLNIMTVALQMIANSKDSVRDARGELIYNDFGGNGPNMQEVAYDALDASRDALAILNNLLLYDQIDDDSLLLRVSPTPIYHFLKTAISLFSAQAHASGIALRLESLNGVSLKHENDKDNESSTDIERNNVVLVADIDRRKMILVIRNLISNALKFTASGGTVSVSVSYLPYNSISNLNKTVSEKKSALVKINTGMLTIEVRDSGCGIPPARQKDVFSEGADMNIDKDGGFGMGLWLAQGIVKKHNGIIRLISTGVPGEGSTFRVELDAYTSKDTTFDTLISIDGDRVPTHNADRHAAYLSFSSPLVFPLYNGKAGCGSAAVHAIQEVDSKDTKRVSLQHEHSALLEQGGLELDNKICLRETALNLGSNASSARTLKSQQSSSLSLIEMTPNDEISKNCLPISSISETPAEEGYEIQMDYKIPLALIVDDSRLNRRMVSRLVNHKFVEMLEAEDGQQALNLVKTIFHTKMRYPDVIFMDHQMPVMTGLESVKLLREMGCDSTILMVTGHALEDDINVFLKAGADQVIIKPLHSESILSILNDLSMRHYYNSRKIPQDSIDAS